MSEKCHKPTCAPSCRQLVEQGLRLLQVRRVETLGEPAVDWSEKFSDLIPLPLIAPQPRHAHGSCAAPRTSHCCARATALSLPVISALRDGHAVDLDIERTGPLRDAEEDSGRRVLWEVAFVDLVEGLEALGGYAEHVALQHVIEVRPRRLQRCLHLFEDALGLPLGRRVVTVFCACR